MKKRNNKKCIVCGTAYTFCNNCGDYSHLPRWKAIYHEENCKNIFEVASDYLAGDITKDEALEKFDACDLANKNNFHSAIICAINDVYDIVDMNEDEVENVEVDSINSEE